MNRRAFLGAVGGVVVAQKASPKSWDIVHFPDGVSLTHSFPAHYYAKRECEWVLTKVEQITHPYPFDVRAEFAAQCQLTRPTGVHGAEPHTKAAAL